MRSYRQRHERRVRRQSTDTADVLRITASWIRLRPDASISDAQLLRNSLLQIQFEVIATQAEVLPGSYLHTDDFD